MYAPQVGALYLCTSGGRTIPTVCTSVGCTIRHRSSWSHCCHVSKRAKFELGVLYTTGPVGRTIPNRASWAHYTQQGQLDALYLTGPVGRAIPNRSNWTHYPHVFKRVKVELGVRPSWTHYHHIPKRFIVCVTHVA